MTEPMFYCEHLPGAGEIARLEGDEARHAGASRRLRPDDVLHLFDGRGNVARATLRTIVDRGRALEVEIQAHQHWPAPRPALHLACALPKGDRASTLLDMATQLGLSSFTPMRSERSVVDPGTGTLERLRRVCLEACKQSRRAHVPTIHAPATLADVLAGEGRKWIAHPSGDPVRGLSHPDEQPLTLLVGPEGGFTEEEVAQALAQGAARVALRSAILRIETAAIALVGMIMLARR